MPIDYGQLINAGIGAYGAYQNAQQANKPQNSTTNQTTTQTPFGVGLISPDIEAALDYQRQLMAAGPRYIGGGGSGAPGGSAGGAGGGGTTGPAPHHNGPATWTNARGETMMLGPGGQAVRAPAGAGGGASGGAGTPGAGGPPAAPQGIDAISQAVATRGLNAGNDPTTVAAQTGVRNILSGQGGANSGGTGFQGYNPILDALSQHDLANMNSEDATALLHQFAGAGGGGGNGAGGAGGSGGYGGPVWTGNPGSGGSGGGGWNNSGHGNTTSSGGNVPDTVGGNDSYFAQQVRQLMDQHANDADLQAIIDAQNADINRGMQGQLWGLDAQAQGTGRFGGDMWAGQAANARHDAAQQMGTFASGTRLNELAQRRAMEQGLLGQVNTRDLGAMSDATQRYGYDTQAASSAAGNASAAASAARGQNLQALLALQQGEQFGTNQLSGIGQQLSQDQLGAINQSQGLAGVGLSGLGAANSAVGNLVGQQGNQMGLRAAQIAAGTARAGLNQQRDIFNAGAPQNAVNDYFNLLRGIGGMGGSSTTQGQNVVAGMGVNPYTAGLLGAGSAYYGGGR